MPVEFPNRRDPKRPTKVVTWTQVWAIVAALSTTYGGIGLYVARSFVRDEVRAEIAKHLADPYAHGEIVRTLAVKQEITSRLDKLGDDVTSVKSSVARIEGRLEARGR